MDSPLEEKELLRRLANDDRKAFDELYVMYMRGLYNFVHLLCKSKDTTEEVLEDLFVKIWRDREKLEQVVHFKVHIYRTAQHLLVERTTRLEMEIKGAEKIRLLSKGSDQQARRDFICQQFEQLTIEVINSLPENRKEILTLRTQDKRSPEEISDLLDIPKFVIKKQLTNGLVLIRDYIHQHNDGFA
ncbi:RNA polymerase sigma factor [Pedobacter sp. L105]|uniref:RNA polymerase sigma factor n=1 Tax=Pedobacter sp. L105 TaxID=1641871 RepID=UPI00131A810C|nr:sigma factor [Pedobacter sp. L105]